MAFIQGLQQYAAENDFGLTAPLTAEQVRRLAEYWKPHICFHYDERYHPIALDDVFEMVLRTWNELSAQDRESLRLRSYAPDGSSYTDHDPPWVFERRGYVRVDSDIPFNGAIAFDPNKPVYEVFGNGTGARSALADERVGTSTVISSGPNGRAARRFFGDDRGAGGVTGTVDAPLEPRATSPSPQDPNTEVPTITVLASLMNLIDLLKYELRLALFEPDYPIDRLRGAFDIVEHLFVQKDPFVQPWTTADKRAKALEMIEAEEAGGAPLDMDLPYGWSVHRTNWNHLVTTTFLEYSFFYAYNDWERVQVSPFDNTHEGDDEGCCLVFDRRQLAEAASSGGPEALLRIPPRKLLTSVHEEWLNADLHYTYPAPVPADLTRPARDYTTVRVYAALGSHATYLTPGSHDVVQPVEFAGDNPLLTIGLGLAVGLFPALGLLALGVLLYEHFNDTVDETSDEGVWAGPSDIVDDADHGVNTRVLVIPMSAQRPEAEPPLVDNVYAPGNTELLTLRSYAGVWGGHNAFPNVSPAFIPKSARYFRNLIR